MFLRWISGLVNFNSFYNKEILQNLAYIKKNFLIIGFMGVLTISTFNSVVYFALNYTQVINAVLILAAIPAATIVFSSIMKIEKTNLFQILGLVLSIIGIGSIISNGEVQKILSLSFNKGDLMDDCLCFNLVFIFNTYLKNISLNFHNLH